MADTDSNMWRSHTTHQAARLIAWWSVESIEYVEREARRTRPALVSVGGHIGVCAGWLHGHDTVGTLGDRMSQ
jgi:hypothetical protein